ncbi:hypothetical protein TNCV_378241 [Trichonephila clavipes]|nr:hypothetical protein TNCV_378241 [Trichonephila clavipes]
MRKALQGEKRGKSADSTQSNSNEKHASLSRKRCAWNQKLRFETGSIRSNVGRASYAEDLKKTSSNYRISIVRAEEHVRGTSAVLMAITKPVTTPIKEEKGIND